jgi:hypothetical protein
MKFVNIVVYEAIAAASAAAIFAAAAVGRNKNKKRKGKRNVRGRGQKRRVKETSVGSLLLLSIVHLRRRVRLIMMIQNWDVGPADPTARDTGIFGGPGPVEKLETE